IPRDILLKSRSSWTAVELELFESHPSRGAEILSTINSVPIDVLQVAKQHHESCSGSGYPAHLRKSAIHPMARLVAVCSEFCAHVLRSPEGPGVPPMEAIHRMQSLWTDRFDPELFNALVRLFRQRVNA